MSSRPMSSIAASQRTALFSLVLFMTTVLLVGCGSSDSNDTAPAGPVLIKVSGPNAVSTWHDIATQTINVPAASAGTAAEKVPISSVDLALVQLAVYDSLTAIDHRYQPFAVTPTADVEGASMDAATAAAAYTVLKGLYPSRTSVYQGPYDSFIAALANDSGRAKGIAVGTEVATKWLSLRGDDGRSVTLAPYVPGTAPGQFRGVNPINRFLPSVKPYALTAAAQFRPVAPPVLSSAAYAADYNETRQLGGAGSALRTAEQLETARFHTEAPPAFWPRNERPFAMTDGLLSDHARLLAMVITVQADTEIACFEAKYFYQAWRPQSAIPLGDTDDNPATIADPSWTPVVPTPNHPEYPAAHACVSSAVTTTLKAYYQTNDVTFSFNSTVTGSTHNFTTLQGLVDEIFLARIAGGMHYRSAMVAGAQLGSDVSAWVLSKYFKPRS